VRKPAFTLEQIRSFVAVAEHEHISRAAASLFLTQAAVTQQVRHFERAVGLQLLERDGRRVRLTDAGRSLADACRAAMRAVEVMDDTAQAAKELQAGSLHVGASPTCATYYLPPHLAEFTRGHPEYVRAATIAGLGFAALPKRAVAADVASGVLKRLPIPPSLRPITAVRRKGRGGPVQGAFWDLLTGGGMPASGKISTDGRSQS